MKLTKMMIVIDKGLTLFFNRTMFKKFSKYTKVVTKKTGIMKEKECSQLKAQFGRTS